jgi:hypothetical protein
VIRREPHTADEITEEIFSGSLLHFERRLGLGGNEIEVVPRDDGVSAYIKASRRTE